jgi:hypothetical protein
MPRGKGREHGRKPSVEVVEFTAPLVKVFGCRPSPVARLGMGPAYENRPSTNPRGCGDGLWGFRVLLGCGDGGTGWALEPARAW